MNFNFGEVLTRAWQIIWKHKILWIFGILASCSRGGGSGNGGSGTRFNEPGTTPNMDQFEQWISSHIGVVVGISILVLILVVLFLFLGTIGRIGLIRGTYQADQGANQLVFGELFSESMPYFWRVFGLSFLIGLIFLLLFIPFILFAVFTGGMGLLCLVPLICLFIPIALVVNVVVEQANAAIVLEDLSIGDGFRRGWAVFRSNIGAVILMAIILIVLSAVVGFVVAIPLIAVVFPAAVAFAAGNGQNNTPLALIGVCICLYLPFAIVLQGILISYVQSAWALTYMRLTNKPAMSAPAMPEIVPPAPTPAPVTPSPSDSEKTLIARDPKDDNKTFIAKKPDA